MTDARAWLRQRLSAAPPSLRARIEGALAPAAEDGVLAEMLSGAAERLLGEAAHGPPDRATALTLLAADALVTLACEWDATRGLETDAR